MLEKARQAERLTAERIAAQERYERYPRGGRGRRPSSTRWRQTHPSPNPLPVIRQSVERLRALDSKIRELTAALSGEVDGPVRCRAGADLAPAVALGDPAGPRRRGAVAVGSFLAATLGIIDLGTVPLYLGAAVAGIGLILTLVAFWLRRGVADAGAAPRRRDRPPPARSLGDGGGAASRPRPTPSSSSARSVSTTWPAAEDLLAREEAHVARMDQLTAQLDGLVGKEPRETLRDRSATRRRSRSTRRRARSSSSGRSRRSRAHASASRSRSATRKPPWNVPATTRRTPAPGWRANTVDAEEVAAEAERLAGWREQLDAPRSGAIACSRRRCARSSGPRSRR